MLAYARSPALLALALDAVMLAYLRSPAFLADVLAAAVLAFPRRHFEYDVLLCMVVFPFFSVGFQLRCVGDALIRWTLAGLEANQQSKRC